MCWARCWCSGGVSQLMGFISARKLAGSVPGIFYVIPVLLLLAGILILVNPFEAAKVPFIVLGVSSIVYGLTDLFRIIRYRQKKEAGDNGCGSDRRAERRLIVQSECP